MVLSVEVKVLGADVVRSWDDVCAQRWKAVRFSLDLSSVFGFLLPADVCALCGPSWADTPLDQRDGRRRPSSGFCEARTEIGDVILAVGTVAKPRLAACQLGSQARPSFPVDWDSAAAVG